MVDICDDGPSIRHIYMTFKPAASPLAPSPPIWFHERLRVSNVWLRLRTLPSSIALGLGFGLGFGFGFGFGLGFGLGFGFGFGLGLGLGFG